MTHFNLGGVKMPAIGLGTFKLKGNDARQAVRSALELGYRHIDTAEMYENETEVGAAIRDSGIARDDIFVTTKVWRDNLAPDDFAAATDGCLARLGMDHVDLLLVHWPNDDIPLGDTLGALRAAHDAGKTRLMGVSNFPSEMLSRALAIEPGLVCNQVEHHAMLGQKPILDVVGAHEMVLTSYSPVAQGKVNEDATIKDIASDHGATPAQVALAYLLGMDRVAAIPKSGTPKHQEENLAAADITLTAEERGRIDGLRKDLRVVTPPFAPDWDV